jgi:p-methyltransferase
MSLDCIIIGYYDEPLETIIKRYEPYKDQNAGYRHMCNRSALINGKRLKFSEIMKESISHSIGIPSDLTNFRMPSLGVHYLTQFLRKRGIETEFINFLNFGKNRLEHLLKHDPPRCIGISTTSHYEPEPLRDVVDFIREINPEPVIVVGGSYISSMNFEMEPEQVHHKLKVMDADIYVHDLQGEQTLYRLCLELRKPNPDFTTMPNLIYYKDREFFRTPREPEDNSLDDDPVTELTFYENHPLPPVYVRAARSCPKECSFCRYPLLGGVHTLASLESVEKNLDYIHSLGVRSLVFVDDSFNMPLDRFKDLLRMMIKKKYGFKWYCFFRCSDADEEAFDLMVAAGCHAVFLGIENGDTTMLEYMNKNATIDDFRWAINQLNARGIMSLASFMVGFPGETEETVQKTYRFIEEVQPTFFELQEYFYEYAVPISKRSDEFGLKGYGYGWEHKTMNWERSAQLVFELFRKVENSTILPTLSFNLWSLGYYLTQGVTLEDYKRLSKIYQKMLGLELHQVDEEYKENERKILSVFKGNKALEENLMSRVKKEEADVVIQEIANKEFNF